MSDSNLSNTILEAIDIISSQRVNSAKYDKTIQGVVLQCVDATIGKYKIQYQDSIFTAYSENTSVSYSAGTSVYILVPNSDMTKTKTIVGAVNKLGANFIQVYDFQEKYNLIGSNFITNSLTQGLCSYTQNQVITLYNFQSSGNKLILNTVSATEYLKQSDLLVVSMDVRTNLNESQRSLGNYGLFIQADFLNQTQPDQEVTKYFALDIDNFIGNPYLYTVDTEQKIAFEIDGQNFVRIRSISLFSKDFPDSAGVGTKPNDIFISNIKLQGARAFTTDELNSSTLALITPRGYIFDKNDKATDYRTIEASVRIKGKKADVKTQGVQFYWFVEDSSITTHSQQYMKEAGQGWRCLNLYNTVNSTGREYISGDYIYTVKKQDVFSKIVRYKCVAIYQNEKAIVLSRQTQMVNFDAQYDITLESDLGTVFYRDIGTPTLTCTCLKKNSSGNYQAVTSSGIKYVWSMVSSAGVFESLSSQGNTFYSISNTLQIDVARLINFAIFKCSVFLNLNGAYTFIGTAALTISNSSEEDYNSYFLAINNGNQLFKYSTTGVSPASSQLDDPIEIKALSCVLYDNKGSQVDILLRKDTQIIWTIPIEDSMLEMITQYTPNENNTLGTIEGMTDIVFKIKDSYTSYYTNNQIELSVTYDGKTIKAKTNFIFIKQGQSGTNGTDFVLKVVPDIKSLTGMPQYPTLTRIGSNAPYANWTDAYASRTIRFDLWHNGDLIYSSRNISGTTTQNKTFTVKSCEILSNSYSLQYSDRQILTLTKNGNYYSLNLNSSYFNTSSFLTTPVAAIIKVVGSYEDLNINTTLPVCIGYIPSGNTNRIFLKQKTGFTKVLYTSSGVKPTYDTRRPFEIEVVENNQVVTNLNNFTFEWNCVGSVWSYINKKWIEKSPECLTIKTDRTGLQKNQVIIKPANNYTGECVTAGLVCRVKKSGSLFGFIYIPIHMSLNQYFNSAIDDWDGNSVDLGSSNGGMILAPQIGAGAKDSSNAFTGIVMGVAKDPKEESSTELGYDIGLFGYHQGKRSIFLDASTGKALFGASGSGQIIIDPSDNNKAILKSGNYKISTSNQIGTGMQIDLADPHIKYGSGNFSVDYNGILTAKQAILEGQLRITNENDGKIVLPNGGMDKDKLWLGGSKTLANFMVDASDGSVTIKKGSLDLGNGSFNVDNSGNITIKRGSINLGNGNFVVNNDGSVTLKSATITGYLTPTDVSSTGTTAIDGSRITTGTISAKRLELTDYAKFTDLSTGGTTVIDGANIQTGTIAAARLDLKDYAMFTDLQQKGKTTINGANITTGIIQSSGSSPNFSMNLSDGTINIKKGQINLGNGNFVVKNDGSVTLKKATITGYLTQDDIGDKGTTTISGNRITTGTIAAKYLDLDGVLKVGALDGYVTQKNLKTQGQTIIDGGNITTGTIKSSGSSPNFSMNLNDGTVNIKKGQINLGSGNFIANDSGQVYITKNLYAGKSGSSYNFGVDSNGKVSIHSEGTGTELDISTGQITFKDSSNAEGKISFTSESSVQFPNNNAGSDANFPSSTTTSNASIFTIRSNFLYLKGSMVLRDSALIKNNLFVNNFIKSKNLLLTNNSGNILKVSSSEFTLGSSSKNIPLTVYGNFTLYPGTTTIYQSQGTGSSSYSGTLVTSGGLLKFTVERGSDNKNRLVYNRKDGTTNTLANFSDVNNDYTFSVINGRITATSKITNNSYTLANLSDTISGSAGNNLSTSDTDWTAYIVTGGKIENNSSLKLTGNLCSFTNGLLTSVGKNGPVATLGLPESSSGVTSSEDLVEWWQSPKNASSTDFLTGAPYKNGNNLVFSKTRLRFSNGILTQFSSNGTASVDLPSGGGNGDGASYVELAKSYAETAETQADYASSYRNDAAQYANQAKTYKDSAYTSAENAYNYAQQAASAASGGGGTVFPGGASPNSTTTINILSSISVRSDGTVTRAYQRQLSYKNGLITNISDAENII